ncbi:PLD nuclease N-terminal domain-containing protein [Natronosalvus halobius]|uniref:PLD nuclease N-terminal domain-containing protein n=1 Tax=Natronosalvus halobius TaxID=2953746 RepID=UPI0020A13D63|nr:PLD nuclease N-terminal domain-containing protein [Natronosalvus halobius]USZ70560.1 PLD nuclease N-terminal domain-containing protein [Natronosalvus halobius]
MDSLGLATLVLASITFFAGLAAYVYRDAREVGMSNPRKWAVIVFAVPVYGAIVYLLARSELDYDPETDPYRGGAVNVHPSRADEVPWTVRSGTDEDVGEDGSGDADAEDEWNDPAPLEDLEDLGADEGDRE